MIKRMAAGGRVTTRTRTRIAITSCLLTLALALASAQPGPPPLERQPRKPPMRDAGAATAAEGVTRRTIKLGLHVPLTGATPVPSRSAEQAKDLFFRWLRAKNEKIHGRYIEVVMRNDQYDPSSAVAACKDLVEREHVFALFGLFQSETQQQACARYAESQGVPYISPSTTKQVFRNLGTYLGVSAPWSQQGRLLADYLIASQGAKSERNGLLTYDGTFADSARRSFTDEMTSRGAEVHYDRRVARTPDSSTARDVVEEMKTAELDNVFMLHTGPFLMNVLAEANDQNFSARWVGIAPTMAYDSHLPWTCPAIRSGRFFSLVPGLIGSDRFDPRFRRAVRRFYPGEEGPDQYQWEAWGAQKVIAKMFRRAGRRFSRASFLRRVLHAGPIATGVMPRIDFTRRDHFGARQVHLLKPDCGEHRWRTVKAFAGDF